MNLITSIAEHAARGLTAAKIAVELELKHGVQVGEAWIEKIMSSDAFAHARADAQAALVAVEHVPAKLESDVVAGEAEIKALPTEVVAAIDAAAAAMNSTPVPAAPEQKAAPDAEAKPE
jgi:hypothetical protein